MFNIFGGASDAVLRLGAKYFRYDGEGRKVVLTALLVEQASHLALSRSDRVKRSQVTCAKDGVQIELELHGGLKLSMRLVPRSISLTPSSVRFVATLPGGVEAEHTHWLMGIVLNLFDTLFGLSGRAVQKLDGVTLVGETLTYDRRVPPEETIFGALGAQANTEATLPVAMCAAGVEIDLSPILPPGQRPNLMALATSLLKIVRG